MSLIGLASKCGVTTTNLNSLIAGKVTVGVASKIGVTSSSLQKFVDGGTSVSLASKLGITSSSLQEFRNSIDQNGAIGFLIGLLHSRCKKEMIHLRWGVIDRLLKYMRKLRASEELRQQTTI